MSPEEVAAGFVRIANESMVKPIKEISVSRGYDVQDYALACFGGAGAQHACAIATMLGMRSILIHPLAGVLSAYGMGLADMSHSYVEAVLRPFKNETRHTSKYPKGVRHNSPGSGSEATATLGTEINKQGLPQRGYTKLRSNDPTLITAISLESLEPSFQHGEQQGEQALCREGFANDQICHHRSLDLRYTGVESTINVPVTAGQDVLEVFETQHLALYGFIKSGHPVEVVNLRVESVGASHKPDETEFPVTPYAVTTDMVEEMVLVYFDYIGEDGLRSVRATPTPVVRRSDLNPGARLQGPALIVEEVSTVVVDPGWLVSVNSRGHLLLEHTGRDVQREKLTTACDPIMLEVFNNLFMSVATQMGKTLERVSHSANIKERLDFSCAVFGPDGDLVANAPHIPVHLGAMGESVRAVLADCSAHMQPGDVYVTNDPYHGGSHLPDITVITPVFADGGTCLFFVANRGHHADIGGITPGSMPPFSKNIAEEGILIHNFLLLSNGAFRDDEITALLSQKPYPARNLPERLSDLRAQVAANVAGARLMDELCSQYGIAVVQAYMGHVRENAAATMGDRIRKLPDGVFHFEDHLDHGAAIRCTITVDGDRARVDFTGTDPQLSGNLNAPPAVVLSAVLYVFRCLVNEAIPLNSGCLDPIEVHIPEGSLIHPRPPAAVVGGNVETSQRVCDVLFGALGVVAAGQGTMNNFSFGTRDFGYYETICGGAGAGPDFDGASAVHTHMTNTRITDPEVLERRYPVLLREFSIRKGSGGQGDFPGGDGVVRTVEFLEAMSASILSERRSTRPYGVHGAEAAKVGENILRRKDGDDEVLPGHVLTEVGEGDILIIKTPGGGGDNKD
jgi:5-oxoprolinase (ATP-hydrolysing)